MIDELRQSKNYPLKHLLMVSGLSKSTYEYYKTSKHLNYIRRKKEEDERILAIITPVFEHHKSRYGYRRIMLANLEGLEGYGHNRIQRVMSENGLKAKQGSNGHYHSYKGDNGESKENLLLHKEIDELEHKAKYIRDFDASKPNEKWTTDVSEFKSDEGKVYLSPILDMFDGSIVSHDISISPDFNQTKRMVDKAFKSNPNLEGLIFHSDQGWQYQMKPYQQWLKDKGIKQSFSRKGNCMDNSLMENFFGIMKNEMYYGYHFKTRAELIAAMEEYITYYNTERINVKRKGLSPLAYRQQSFNQLTLS